MICTGSVSIMGDGCTMGGSGAITVDWRSCHLIMGWKVSYLNSIFVFTCYNNCSEKIQNRD